VVEELGIALGLVETGGTGNCIGVNRVVEELGIALELIEWWRNWELHWG
jgi:P2-related tail formation protein